MTARDSFDWYSPAAARKQCLETIRSIPDAVVTPSDLAASTTAEVVASAKAWSRRQLQWIVGFAMCVGCAGAAPVKEPPGAPGAVTTAESAPAEGRYELGRRHLRAGRYAEAEAAFRAVAGGSEPAPALLSLAEVLLITGRYDEALESARRAARANPSLEVEAAALGGEALRRQGQLDEAEALLRKFQSVPEARRPRLLLGEILMERGRADAAEPVLMTLIEDYNSDRVRSGDARGLAMVGRAAHLLRYPEDANDAFNEAERAAGGDIPTLLWRAELFLEKYNPGDAEAVLNEVLQEAPEHPEALVWMAHVRLAQALDFDESERLARKALKINPKLSGAYFVLAGIALRDMELELADQHLDAGLKHNPRDLELLSLKAAVRYLAEDEAGFQAAKAAVLGLNPNYARMYSIIGEYADWEHRYEELVDMMRQAVLLDPDDAKAHAQLGLNLIRAGQEDKGLVALRTAWNKDKFNMRVFNTLELYEKNVANNYVTVEHQRFRIRYPKQEKEILDRYVPELLDKAWEKMVKAYGFRPHVPTGIELYADRKSFAIRTSGLPHTAIQGVCFGKTLAAMSLGEEKFNLGMTLWHELAHVFHIQLSESRVPRWFTEGLAEYETLAERTEWVREHDAELFEALRAQRLPKLGSMSRAFTRAEQMSDVATAYYASSQIAVMLVERFTMQKAVKMLELWGKGKQTPEVIRDVLGMSADQLDAAFRSFLDERLARYRKQFVPVSRTGSLAAAAEQAKRHPKDKAKQARYALSLLRAGRAKLAEKALKKALAVDPKYPDARYFLARLELHRKAVDRAHTLLQALVKDGHDGYAVQMLLADVADARRNKNQLKKALEAAHRFDASRAEPLAALAEFATKAQDKQAELDALRKLAALEEHDGSLHRRLVRRLLDAGHDAEALRAAEAALYADLSSLETHALLAEALLRNKQPKRAAFELESATLCPGRPAAKADAHARLAALHLQQSNVAAAKKQAELARQLDPENARLKTLSF